MAAVRNGSRKSVQERERARLYEARRRFHASISQRRRRDNVAAIIVGGLVIAGVIGGQVAYYTLGPGAPSPSPSPTATMDSTPAPSTSPTGSPTSSPAPATPSPSATPTR